VKRGLFITLEGPEGAGKTVQAARLCEALEADGLPYVCTREPGGSPAAERLREVVLHEEVPPSAEALIFLAARAIHVQNLIKPALAEGRIVICDRFTDSTIAYQGYGLGIDLELLRQMCAFAAGGLEPDLTLLLDLPPQVGIARRYAGGRNRAGGQLSLTWDEDGLREREKARSRIEERALSFHNRVREGFLAEARRHPQRFRVIDANRSPDEVAAELIRLVREAIASGGPAS
jgi:dTMP kinase